MAALYAAQDAEEWATATTRIKGLAASFGALRVLDAATDAAAFPPGNISAISRIERALSALQHEPTA